MTNYRSTNEEKEQRINEAADELRDRIRALLFEKQQDDDDPRINRKGLI